MYALHVLLMQVIYKQCINIVHRISIATEWRKTGKMMRHFVMIAILAPALQVLGQTQGPGPVRFLMGGRVAAFFNETVDSSKALPGNFAHSRQNLEQRVVDAIAGANSSIDMAAYELTSLNIVSALCQARSRGVRVRLVVDHEASYKNNEKLWNQAKRLLAKYDVPYLDDSGFPLIRDKKGRLSGYDADMHHKFLVIDRLSKSREDDVVWMGSYNFTISGMISAQNLLYIRSAELASLYTEEFEILWGGSQDKPDVGKSKFHASKPPVSASNARITGDREAYVAFAPMDLGKQKPNFLHVLADLVTREADHDIRICAFSFTAGTDLEDAIREKIETRGVDLKAVFDNTLGKQRFSSYHNMAGTASAAAPWKGSVEALLSNEDGKLHHKYILIGAENPDSKDIPVLITGSFNFSKNANLSNDENFVVLRDREVANVYLQEFYARLRNARKGSADSSIED